MTKLTAIEGIGTKYAEVLQGAGITSVEQLLEVGATTQGRSTLAEKSAISGTLILKWINRADLFRIKGIGEEYADLLEAAGVDTVPELAQRNAENLYQKLLEINAAKKLVRRPPAQTWVSEWIKQAKDLPRIIQY